MREVIQQVLATEEEAKRMVEAAKMEANRILANAQQQGQELMVRMRQQAEEEGRAMINAAVQAAEREKRERLARLTTEIDADVRIDDNIRQRVVQAIVRTVCGERESPTNESERLGFFGRSSSRAPQPAG